MVFTMLTSYNRLCVYDWLFGYNFSRSIHTAHNPHAVQIICDYACCLKLF